MKVVITGHRQVQEDLAPTLFKILKRLGAVGCDTLMSGMAEGTDIMAARLALSLHMKVEAVIPHFGHDFNHAEQKEYWQILAHEDSIVSWAHQGPYFEGSFFNRNEFMVDTMTDDDILLAIMSNDKSGTGHCMRAAQRKNKKIHIYNPETHQWSKINA